MMKDDVLPNHAPYKLTVRNKCGDLCGKSQVRKHNSLIFAVEKGHVSVQRTAREHVSMTVCLSSQSFQILV